MYDLKKINKTGKVKPGLIFLWVFLSIGAVAGVFFALSQTTLQTTEPGETPTVFGACTTQTSPSLSAVLIDELDQSKGGSATFTLYVDGVKSTDSSSPFDVPPLKPYELVSYNGTGVDKGAYSVITTGTVPCDENPGIEVFFVAQGNLSLVSVENEQGQIQSGGTNNVTLGADDIKTATIEVEVDNDQVWNNPNSPLPSIVCFDYNTTAYDSVTEESDKAVSVPRHLVGTYEECSELPKAGLRDLENLVFSIVLDSSQSANPNGAGLQQSPATGDVRWLIEDSDLYIDKEGKRVFSYADHNGNDIGQTGVIGYVEVN